jgi:SAM-dependent methyltransferase
VEKFSSLRQEAARQILNIYRYENSQWNDLKLGTAYFDYDRNGRKYAEMMNGLTATLDYVGSLPDSNIVLDLGTGTGRACADLARQFKNLTFIGTGLHRYPGTERFLSGGKFILTSGENLGIKDKSIAGVIANSSITYSHAQQLIAKRIDEVLVPGGIVKATFLF